MALSVDYLYNFYLKLTRYNQSAKTASTEFAVHWNDASSAYMDDLLGRFQKNNNGKTGANTGLILDETVMQKLSPFIQTSAVTINTGVGNKPTGFIYRLAFRINGFDCYKINHNQISEINRSVIDPPSIANNSYYFTENLATYSILPATYSGASELNYISTPVNVVWGFTYDVNGRQVYDSPSSVQPLWDTNSCREITKRMLVNIGVSLKDKDFLSFGKSVQMAGE